jgi:hypothetical protein
LTAQARAAPVDPPRGPFACHHNGGRSPHARSQPHAVEVRGVPPTGAQVTFEAHPPTQRTGEDQVLLDDTVFIGGDDHSGGGGEAGLDARQTYRLDFTGITPHPMQGFHVKLTVNAEGSQGADTRHKVFWVTGCKPGSPRPRSSHQAPPARREQSVAAPAGDRHPGSAMVARVTAALDERIGRALAVAADLLRE